MKLSLESIDGTKEIADVGNIFISGISPKHRMLAAVHVARELARNNPKAEIVFISRTPVAECDAFVKEFSKQAYTLVSEDPALVLLSSYIAETYLRIGENKETSDLDPDDSAIFVFMDADLLKVGTYPIVDELYQYLCSHASETGVYLNLIGNSAVCKRYCHTSIVTEVTNAAGTSMLLHVGSRADATFDCRLTVE